MKFNLANVTNGLTRKVVFNVKKASPELFIAAGIVGGITSAVLACKATLKLDEVLEEHKATMKKVHDTEEEAKKDPELAKKYSEEDVKHDTTVVYVKTAFKVARLYAPSVILGAVSIGCVLKSHSIMKTRNLALGAALTTLDKKFKNYREGVIERFGEDIDNELRCGIREKEVEVEKTDEKGKVRKEKTTIKVADPDKNGSPYMRYFSRSNPYWDGGSTNYVKMFLKNIQNTANDRLKASRAGFITLNEVYEMLGFTPDGTGMVVGWRYDPRDKSIDSYIEFDVKEICVMNEHGEYENAFSIDFNVDGQIFDKVKAIRG